MTQMASFHSSIHSTAFYIIFVTGNILEYKKKKTGFGEQSCISAALNLSTTHNTSRRTSTGRHITLPTYNRDVVQHVVFDSFGLARPHKYSWQAATCHPNSAVQGASSSI